MTGTMDKLKNILSPGHKKDEETLYGAGEGSHGSTSHHTGSTTEGTTTGHSGHNTGVTSDSSRQHDSTLTGTQGEGPSSNVAGVGRQILNPNSEKYSEASYGPAGTHTAVEQLPPSVGADQQLYTDPAAAKKEHGILRQILNPHGDKYDETRFGTTATTEPPTAATHTGNSHIGSSHTGNTTAPGTTTAGATAGGSELTHHQHNQYGSSAPHTHAATGAASGTTRREDEHHLGRDAALAGGAASGAALATHGARDRHDAGDASTGLSHHVHNGMYNKDGTHSHAHSTGTVGHTGAPTSGTGATSTLPAVPNTGGAFLGNQSGTYPNTSSNSNERSFPLSGGATSTLPDRSTGHNTAGGNHGREGLAAAAGAATLASSSASPHEHQGYGHQYHGANMDPSSHTGGPHATVAANRLDPNIDRSGSTTATGSTTAAGSDHHYGRDAALAGAAGAGAAGAYEAGKHTGDRTGPAPNTIGPHDKDWKNVLDPRVKPEPSQMKSSAPDATGPATSTVGPHDKNWQNVVDPRVTPAQNTTSHSHGQNTSTQPSVEEARNYGLGTGAETAAGPRAISASTGTHSSVAPHGTHIDTSAPHDIAATQRGSLEHDSHHGRNTAAAGGLAAAGATAAYSGSSSHHHQQPNVEESRNYGLGTGANTASAPHADSTIGHSSSSGHHHGGPTAIAGGAGAGAAGVAAGHAWKEHEHKHHTVQGEKGMSSTEANPYSSHGIDPRVDGRHATTTTSGHAGSSRVPGSDPSGHHFGRDAAIAGSAVGAGGMGAHELGSHHGTQVGNEGLGAHNPATHHGTSTSTTAGSGTTDLTSDPARRAYGDSLSNDGKIDPLFVDGADIPAPGSTYRGEHHADEKLQHARENEAAHAHDEHEAGGKKKSGIFGFLHRDKKDKHEHEHDEDRSEPHLHSDDRNRLHKDPPKGHPAAEGTTIGTGSGVTAETYGPSGTDGATKTGRELS